MEAVAFTLLDLVEDVRGMHLLDSDGDDIVVVGQKSTVVCRVCENL